jgi:hypothetical protein
MTNKNDMASVYLIAKCCQNENKEAAEANERNQHENPRD